MSCSETETVLHEEDSPLSPCLWTQEPQEIAKKCHVTTEKNATSHCSTKVSCARDKAIKLSPHSQLHVLSQISELAHAQSPQSDTVSRFTQETKRSNMWGAALHKTKQRKASQLPVASRRKQKTTNKMQKMTQVQTARLATDMLDWETCSEGDLFTLEEENDNWMYEEIYDSDFESDLTPSLNLSCSNKDVVHPNCQQYKTTSIMTSKPMQWQSPPAANDHDNSISFSISNVFADMLHVNEDRIAAIVECQAEETVDGLLAYQRLLHRDLMEMAEFIDSMYGVYSNTSSTSRATNSMLLSRNKNTELEPRDVEVTTDSIELTAENRSTTIDNKPGRKKAQRSALLTAIEAGEKVRETRRSKEQWLKSRHQVLEEEGVSAIMNKTTSGMLEVGNAPSGEKESQQEGEGGLALANQLRAHQHIAAFLQALKETRAIGPPASMNLLLANQLAMHTVTPPLAVPAPVLKAPPMPVPIVAAAEKKIKPSPVGNKIALPPAHSMYNTLYTFPEASSLMFHSQATAGFMPMPPWQHQLPTALPARTVVPARNSAKKPRFKRMCESCRKRHFSLRQCRLVLQHTDPEWQPAQPPSVNRRRRRKQSTTTTTQVT